MSKNFAAICVFLAIPLAFTLGWHTIAIGYHAALVGAYQTRSIPHEYAVRYAAMVDHRTMRRSYHSFSLQCPDKQKRRIVIVDYSAKDAVSWASDEYRGCTIGHVSSTRWRLSY